MTDAASCGCRPDERIRCEEAQRLWDNYWNAPTFTKAGLGALRIFRNHLRRAREEIERGEKDD